MPRIRLFPIVLFVLTASFFVRGGHLIERLMDKNSAVSVTAQAYAKEKKTENSEKPIETVVSKEKQSHDGEQEDKEQADEASSGGDPFAPQFSDAELEVLQSLSKRREELDTRARTLDEKEKLLEITEQKIDKKIAEMNGLRAEIETLLDQQQEVEEARFKKLVKIYENMKPKDAARIFNELQFDVLISVVDRMSERKTAPILAAMDPIRARYLSAKLAEQKALPKPQ